MSSRNRLATNPPPAPCFDEEEQPTAVRAREPLAHEESGVWRVPASIRPPAQRPIVDDGLLHATYAPLVRRIAHKTLRSLPRTILLEDLVSAGWVGMTEALRRRPEEMPEDQFEAYASYRIRGAILDHLRSLDPLPRRLRGLSREIHAASRLLSQRFGRPPTEEELASELKMSLAHLQRALAEIQEAGLDRVDAARALDAPSAEPSPEAAVERAEAVRRVKELMEGLPERLRLVLALHYEHECNLREIGAVLGVTESRACQLHAEAVHRIQKALMVPPGQRRLGRGRSS